MFKFIAAAILSTAITTHAFAFTNAEQEAAYAGAGLKKHAGGKFSDECGSEISPVLRTVELGALGEAAMLKIDDVSCYGNAGSRIMLFRREGNHLQVIFDNNAGDITVLKTSHMGVFDLELDMPGMGIPIWKWNGRKYELWKSRTAGKPAKGSPVTQPPVAAAPVVQDRAKYQPWMFSAGNGQAYISSGVADDGSSLFTITCGGGTPSVSFTFYPDGYHGHALNKVLDLEQPFVVEVRQTSGKNENFPILAYFVADGGWTQEARRHMTGTEASAFLDAVGQEGRLGLQTGKGVEVASWTLKDTSQMRESMRKVCNL